MFVSMRGVKIFYPIFPFSQFSVFLFAERKLCVFSLAVGCSRRSTELGCFCVGVVLRFICKRDICTCFVRFNFPSSCFLQSLYTYTNFSNSFLPNNNNNNPKSLKHTNLDNFSKILESKFPIHQHQRNNSE